MKSNQILLHTSFNVLAEILFKRLDKIKELHTNMTEIN